VPVADYRAAFLLKEHVTYPFEVRLRPRDENLSMDSDIVPWLDENVEWERKWELQMDTGAGSIARRHWLYVFRVRYLEDAILVRLRFT
jgi:hypothetical protein